MIKKQAQYIQFWPQTSQEGFKSTIGKEWQRTHCPNLYYGCTAEMSESANIVLGTLARFVFCAFKPERIVERSTAAEIWCGNLFWTQFKIAKLQK